MKNKIKRQTSLKCLPAARVLLLITVILSFIGGVRAQENKEIEPDVPLLDSFENYKKPTADGYKESAGNLESLDDASSFAEREPEKAFFAPLKNEIRWRAPKKDDFQTNAENVLGGKNFSQLEKKEKFHWKPALLQSSLFLGFQHGYRLATQTGTRSELHGKFFREYVQSAKNLRGWNDGNRFFINYIGHPLQGGVTGQIFVNNSDRAKRQEFGKSKAYWESRFKAMVWSAAWSTQFELGPISEASLGNVGLHRRGKYSTMAYVDLVVTPVLGTTVLVAEDAIDRYVFKNWLERKAGGRATRKIKILRSLLTPTASIANVLRFKKPWKRNDR